MSRSHSSSILPVALVGAMLVLALSVGACSKKTNTETGGTAAESTNTSSNTGQSTQTATPGALTDANIAAIVLAANDVDIDNGKLAQSKTKSDAVKGLASQMVHDHGSSNDQAKDLAKRLSLSPQDDATSNQLKTNGDAKRESLKSLEGAAFDRAYVDNEVAYHEAVLDMLDKTLIPGAQNAELKTLLKNTRPVVAAHLEHAKKVQKQLGGTRA